MPGSASDATGTYKIELDNAFGLVPGADFKVAGVRAGTISSIKLDQNSLFAIVTVDVTQGGFGAFHADAFCQSRPQSLIGEYFIDCQPGRRGPVLAPGSTIPVTHTQSTIAADLLLNVLRLPYRQRMALIINELGAAAAGRSGDIEAALRRAVPAITQTDNLLHLLANDSRTLQRLTVSADTADDRARQQRPSGSAVHHRGKPDRDRRRRPAHKPPGLAAAAARVSWRSFSPAMAQLGAAATANTPVAANLNSAATQLHRLFADLPAFSTLGGSRDQIARPGLGHGQGRRAGGRPDRPRS